MGLYTYNFSEKKRDLTDVLSTVIKGQPRFISMFPTRGQASQQKHEWLEDQIRGRSVTATDVTTLQVTATTADVAKLKVGTLMVVKDDSALFRVASKDTDTKFTVELVAANGSSTTTPATDDILNIVSTPIAEGSANEDGEESYRALGNDYNYCQIIRKEICLTGTAMAINVYGNVENSINAQTKFALDEAARDLNRAALFGRRVQPTSVYKGEFAGLYYYGTQVGGLSVNAANTPLDSYLVNDGAQAVQGEGGSPSVILCGTGQARVLSNENKDTLQIVREDSKRGAYVAVIINEITGGTMTIVADPDLPDQDAWILDPSGFGLVNLSNRSLSDEDTTPKGYDGIRRTALGELTLEFKNAKQRLCRIYNLKASATALAAIRAADDDSVS